MERPERADRLTLAVEATLAPDSLVGSFFHSDAERGWQGCIVAEPSPGIYLVETFDWLVGESGSQKLVGISAMQDWNFYDSAEWMRNNYEHGGLRQRWDRERQEAPA